MMSNEHGMPDRVTGARGGDDLAEGLSPNGSRGGYSALTGGDTPDLASAPAPEGDGSDGSRGAVAGPLQGDASSHEPEPGGDDGSADGPSAVEDATASPRKRRVSAWRELPILIVVALVIALVIKTFVVQPFFIPSSSMENTLMIGDKVLVDKLVYHFRGIKPGDIIVFDGDGSWNPNPPSTPPPSNIIVRGYDDTLRPLFSSIAGLFGTPLGQTDYVKRVIGVPGDRVACCNAQGLVTVNGVPLHEQSYIIPGAAPSDIHFHIVVPPGRLWVMGDNRPVSDDSRLRMSDPGMGTIPENKVIGRAFVIVWPPSHWRILSIPSTFSQTGIDKTSSSSAAARKAALAESAGLSRLLGARVEPSPPYLPLAAGLVGAVPLTWLQRRARRGLTARLRRSRASRHS